MSCRFASLLLALFLFLIQSPAAWAQLPEPPEVAARAYVLMDLSSGQTLAGRNADDAVEPASLTKLMTAYVVFDALKSKKLDLQQRLPVSERAWKMPGSRMFIDPRMTVPVDDLLKGMIVQSGNDATVALAEGVAGSVDRFVRLMNEQAGVLGLKGTRFHNPEGLTAPGHQTSAKDLALLATRLLQDFPQFMHYYAIQRYRYPGTPAANETNRNLLLFRDPTVDGLKTGHTDAAGYCLVATAKRPYPNVGERRLLAVVLGAASEQARAAEAQKLLNWGYAAFEPVKLFEARQAVVTPKVWKGVRPDVPLGRGQAIVVAVPSGAAAQIKTQVLRPDPLVAPLRQGQALGTLRVSRVEQVLVDVPLQVLDEVGESGVIGRAWDALRLWIR